MNSAKNVPITSLSIFGGMAPELAPADLPAGPAVVAEDVDFDSVGSVRTRDGIASVFSYSGLSDTSAASGGTASGVGAAWLDPSNVTLGIPGTYAFVTISFDYLLLEGGSDLLLEDLTPVLLEV
jgi:hypothetical protein